MKSTKKVNWNRISKSFKQYLKEAEEEAPAEEEGGANPFAAGGAEAPATPAAPAAGTPPAADAAPADPAAAATPPTTPAGVPIKFNIDKVKRYNSGKFLSDAGVVKSIDKKGIIVTTQPDGVDILVNFDDISENVKRFFKSKK